MRRRLSLVSRFAFLRNISIRRRILLIFLIGGVGVGAVFLYVWQSSAAFHTRREIDDHLHLAQLIAVHVDDHLDRMLSSLASTAASSPVDLTDEDLGSERAALADLYARGLFAHGVFLLDGSGQLRLAVPQNQMINDINVADMTAVAQVLAGHGNAVSDLIWHSEEATGCLLFLMPVRNASGDTIAVLGGAVDPAEAAFTSSVTLLPLPVEGYVNLIDGQGMILASQIEDLAFTQSHHLAQLQPLIEQRQADGLITRANGDQPPAMVVFAPLRHAPWGVTMELPLTNVLAPVENLRFDLLALLAALVLAGLAGSAMIFQTLIVPLRALQAAADGLASGALETPIPAVGRDEIADLGRSFEAMRAQLVDWGRTLERKVVRRTRRLEALNRLAHAMHASPGLDDVLWELGRELIAALDAEVFFVALYNPATNNLDHRVRFDRGVYYPPESYPLREGLTAQVLARRELLYVADFEQEQERLPAARLWGSGEIPRTWLGVPFLRRGEAIGVISVQAYRPEAFTLNQIEFLQTAADEAAVAVQKTRLQEETARRAQQLALVNEIGRDMTRLADDHTLLQETTRHIVERLGYHAAAVYIAEGERLTLTAGYSDVIGPAPEGVEVLSVGEGIVGEVAQTLESILVPDVAADERYRSCEGHPEVRSELAAPVFNDVRLTGVLDVRVREPGGLDDGDRQLLEAIAGQLAKSLSNGRLYNQVQQQAQRAKALNKIISAAASVLAADDLAELQETALDLMLEALGVEIGAVWVPPYNAVRGVDREAYQSAALLFRQLSRSGGLFARELVVVDDSQDTSALLPEALREAMAALAVRASIMASLVVDGQRVGGISVAATQPRRWLPEEVALLETVGQQIALVLERTRLLQETQAKTERLAIVNRLGRIISSSLDLREVFQSFAQDVSKLISFERVALPVISEDQTSWETLALWTRSDPALLQGEIRPVANSWVERMLADPEPWLEGELGEKGDWSENAVLRREGVRSRVLLPLIVKGRLLGALAFGSDQPHAYSEADLEVLLPLADQMAIAVENSRLYRSAHQQLAELSAIGEVSAALRGAQTVDDMLPIILDKTLELVEAESGAISLIDSERGEMFIPVARGAMAAALPARRFPLDESLTGEVLRRGDVYIASDLTSDPFLIPGFRANLRGHPSGVAVPLIAGDAPLGMIAVAWEAAHTSSADETRILAAIADLAANAIRRAGLFEQLQQRVHELSQLYGFGRMITANLRLEELQAKVCEVAIQAVRASRSYLFLWNESEQRLLLTAVSEMPALVGRVKYRLGEGLVGWVFLNREAANVPDVAADPRWKREAAESEGRNGLSRNALAVPLQIGDKALGVLGVDNRISAPAFTTGDQSLLTALAGQVAVAIEKARLYEDVRDLSVATIRSLATAIDARDPYTHGHSEGVAALAVRLARALGWSEADLEMMEFAGLLHDAGKIAIPDVVLRKPGKLSDEEWRVMRMHTYHSAQIIKPVASLQRIVPWVYHHHERWDGGGYPDGIAGERIPPAARVIMLADTYDAITTDRPYRTAFPGEHALAEIQRCAGSQFDPALAAAFVEMMNEAQ